MGGGLLQLVAYGAQDVYLTGNPQITFFKYLYRRHTNFSIEPREVSGTGNKNFNGIVDFIVLRQGDLLGKLHLMVKLKANTTKTWGYVNKLGFAMIDTVAIYVGGTKIDEHTGDYLNIWHELTNNIGHNTGFNKMIGNTSNLTKTDVDHSATTLYIPLQFWFCKNYGLALPHIALDKMEVKIQVKFKTALECINYTGTTAPSSNLPEFEDVSLLVENIYLDNLERNKFATSEHEYLIDQVQIDDTFPIDSYNKTYDLNLDNPCKFVIWAGVLAWLRADV